MSAAVDRQTRPIYEAIDTGSNKSAILACNKLLKKQPKNALVKALKALALVRSQKVLASKPNDDATLAAMMHVLRGLGRHTDMVAMYEDAYKLQPTNEELGSQTFFANVRIGNWKAAQQVATKMHKQFQDDHYLFWSVMSAVLQANDPITPPSFRGVLFKLAHRLILSSQAPSYCSADRFYLHLTVLRELGLLDDAHTLLSHEAGQAVCASSLACDEVRREIWKLKGLGKEEGVRAREKIEAKDRNWSEFLSLLDGTFWDLTHETNLDPEVAKASCAEQIAETRKFLVQIAEEDGERDRSAHLALLELEKRARQHGLSSDPSELPRLLENYFQRVGDKFCCFEDLQPYVQLDGDELAAWTSFLETQPSTFVSTAVLNRYINAQKLIRYNLTLEELTPELESPRAAQYLRSYMEALKFGTDLPDTELQPADDLAVLASQVHVSAWKSSGQEVHLYNAAAVLEYASSKSKPSYQIRLSLVRIYRLLCAPSLALEQYRAINVKQIQNDTLSHFLLSRASLFSLSSTGDLTYSSECLESSQIYLTNSQDTAEFIVRAFSTEKYTQIPDFILFEDRLDNSLQRDLTKVEHVRMRIVHEQLNSELVDMELIELKFIFDRFHHDNRDFDILPNYQSRFGPSFNEQTLLFEKSPGVGWLSIFLKLYIRAFQLASDLDDMVEDKLLIGDRPKPSFDPETKLPLSERLSRRKQEELDELTPDELAFLEYATALANWLAPYHDYVRPPPQALPPKNGTTNGHAKKEEDPPAVTEPPEIVSKYFDYMAGRFKEVLEGGRPSYEVLQVATLTQEAGSSLLALESTRFKPASVVKINKLGALVQSFKELRTKVNALLTEMSTSLVKLGEKDATVEGRKAIVESCKAVWGPSQLEHDFVSGISKKVTESRKQVADGVGKGILRVLKNHA
ncbi:actin cytoskeleton organization protein [Amylocystis lapponica]|nr:actin cytoskeleton organization protein [Amylocystis lapponica]